MHMSKPFNKTSFASITIVFASMISSTQSYADIDAQLGVASVSSRAYIKGEKDSTEILPFLDITVGRWNVNQDGLSYELPLHKDDETFLSFALSTSGSVYDPSDNKLLKHLDEPDKATEFSITYAQAALGGLAYVTAGGDVSDTYKGFFGGIGFDFTLPLSPNSGLIVETSLDHKSRDFVDYYYGISPDDATANITAYKGKAAINTHLSVFYAYEFNDHWAVLGGTELTWFGKGISHSSITQTRSKQEAIAALIYTF